MRLEKNFPTWCRELPADLRAFEAGLSASSICSKADFIGRDGGDRGKAERRQAAPRQLRGGRHRCRRARRRADLARRQGDRLGDLRRLRALRRALARAGLRAEGARGDASAGRSRSRSSASGARRRIISGAAVRSRRRAHAGIAPLARSGVPLWCTAGCETVTESLAISPERQAPQRRAWGMFRGRPCAHKCTRGQLMEFSRRQFMRSTGASIALISLPGFGREDESAPWTLPAKEPVITFENLWIPLSNGYKLGMRLWLPKSAPPEPPVPVVLEYLPYRKRDLTRSAIPVGYSFAPYGFAYGASTFAGLAARRRVARRIPADRSRTMRSR